ncbi:MAG: hypothetical protein J3K34DRAFT_413184, partial [Monoraphidium minutum]
MLGARIARRVLGQGEGGAAAAPQEPQARHAPAWGTDAHVAYTSLSPGSVQMLIRALELNCGGLQAGRPLPVNCSSIFRRNLAAAGVPLDAAAFSAVVLEAHAVTLNLHFAIGLTKGEVDDTTDEDLARWLSDAAHVSSLLAAAGLDDGSRGASATWLQRPEVLFRDLGHSRYSGVNLGLAIGLAVPLGACLIALTGVVAALVLRRRRGGDAAGAAVAGGGGGAAASG